LLLDELKFVFAAWLKQAHADDASTDDTHITAYPGTAKFLAPYSRMIYLKGGTTLFTELCKMRTGLLIYKQEKAREMANYYKTLNLMTSVVHDDDQIGTFFSLQPTRIHTF
jgi:hypothetical protein